MVKMNCVLSTSHGGCTLRKAVNATNQLFSRLLTSHSLLHDSDKKEEFLLCYRQRFDQGANLLEHSGLDLSSQLQHGSLSSPHLLNKVVSFCAKSAFLRLGIQVHTAIIKLGFCSNVYICSALVDMYGKCETISYAQTLFDEMSYRNEVTWNSLISGYLQVECPVIAIDLFVDMLRMGIAPTPFSISDALVACSQMEAGELGTQVHGLCMKAGFSSNAVIGTGLIDMYSKCWDLEDSRRIFDRMLNRNVISWTSMVAAYAQNRQPDEAMVLEGLESHAFIAVGLIIMYSECSSSLEDFWKVCSGVTEWDQISWNAVISGLSNLEDGEEALICFSTMRQAGGKVDFFTYASILRAIGIISALHEGKQIHALIFRTGHTSKLCVQNGLVSMYARCGIIDDSKKVFSSMKRHDLISWNSLLSGCAHHGYGREAVYLFEKMRRTEIKPNNTTFLILFTACSHAGLLDRGLKYFELMKNDHTLEPPEMEHYATIVDLFGRHGNLHEAEAFINSMPILPGPSVYKALLSACQVHGNKEIALRSAKELLKLCPNDPAAYILLSNVLVTEGYWDDAEGVRKLMCDRGVMKNPGYSWIQANKKNISSLGHMQGNV
ncbi:putative Pentatricopeptide repeat-containing protein [Quillaja saponaria]|uniref:Pentatricopeptide repeat-containing protein n=1 Tax=Quillaja saponaria TaxID=32244 RepID=A0AAD7KXC2_QUISA|nr:putative Pentatricopeptide repeat-containing protein [Quillaja saponaria]